MDQIDLTYNLTKFFRSCKNVCCYLTWSTYDDIQKRTNTLHANVEGSWFRAGEAREEQKDRRMANVTPPTHMAYNNFGSSCDRTARMCACKMLLCMWMCSEWIICNLPYFYSSTILNLVSVVVSLLCAVAIKETSAHTHTHTSAEPGSWTKQLNDRNVCTYSNSDLIPPRTHIDEIEIQTNTSSKSVDNSD